MSEKEKDVVAEEVEAEKKELGDLIQDVIKALQTIKKEAETNSNYNREFQKWLNEKIIKIIEGQANMSANQKLLFQQLRAIKEGKTLKQIQAEDAEGT